MAAAPAAAADCADLAELALPDGEVTSAELVQAGGFSLPPSAGGPPPGVMAASFAELPAFCRVQATRRPSADSDIKVEVWLPAEGWNGKFVGIGNGIWAGSISYVQLAPPLAKGYAVAATDAGHQGNGMSADFAASHPEKLVDFGYRAVHEMVVTAKRAIDAFYGRAPEYSFWDSCSTGGRQGLMAAHRYPEDFDAISAMAPANPMTDLMVQSMWAGWMPHRFPDARLTPQHLALVRRAVLAQCDADDGLEDGIIGRPLQCGFDPATLQCTEGTTNETCLTPGQVQAVRGLYDGVQGADGAQLLPGWPRGSEMQLVALVMGEEPFPVATSYFRQLVYGGQAGWDWRATPYGEYLAAAREYGAEILDVPSDGLGPFFERGGKLLLSHGWNDGLIPAANTLAFHHRLYNALPRAQADDQLRLYMAPGMDHCSGGEGVSRFDTLGVIDRWATTGIAPHAIRAERAASPMPGAPQLPPLSRPLCPWPLVERFAGSGERSDAASFTCSMP
jgi:hypothetical protein